MSDTKRMSDKAIIKKLSSLSGKELLLYAFGITKILYEDNRIEDDSLERMITNTKKHAGHLWNGK